MIDLEICVDSVDSAVAADRGGAQRIELCSALSEGGITPSSGLIRSARAAIGIDLFVIIRPRGGDFIYTKHEIEVMRRDIGHAKELGANGVVLGALTAQNRIDVEGTQRLVEEARPLQVTFHRAFDLCEDPKAALETVIQCGAERILTSGGKFDATRGTRTLAQLCAQAGDRIRIMAGGGVRGTNVAQLVKATGIRDVHTSLNEHRDSVERKNHHGATAAAHLNAAPPFLVAEEDVRSFRMALDLLPNGKRT